jgi:hypothetical protein
MVIELVIRGYVRGRWVRERLRKTSNLLPRFSLVLPYSTLSSVVGLISGTTSGMTRYLRNALRTSAARAAEMPGVEAHVEWRSLRYGDAYAVEAVKRSESEDFIAPVCSMLTLGLSCSKAVCGYICYCVT